MALDWTYCTCGRHDSSRRTNRSAQEATLLLPRRLSSALFRFSASSPGSHVRGKDAYHEQYVIRMTTKMRNYCTLNVVSSAIILYLHSNRIAGLINQIAICMFIIRYCSCGRKPSNTNLIMDQRRVVSHNLKDSSTFQRLCSSYVKVLIKHCEITGQ